MKRLFGLGFVVLTACSGADPARVCTTPYVTSEPAHASVGPLTSTGWIARTTPGQFILVRERRGRVLAVRFTNVRAADAAGTGCAHYDVHDVATGRVVCTGEVSSFDPVGVHPIVWNPGDDGIPCLPGRAWYAFPSELWIRARAEIAATHWTTLAEIDPSDPALQWRRDPQ